MAGTIHSLEKENRALALKERKSEGVLASLKQDDLVHSSIVAKIEHQVTQLVNLVSKLRQDNENKRKQLETGVIDTNNADAASAEIAVPSESS